MMRVIICGGRHYNDARRAFAALDEIAVAWPRSATVLHGAAPGADMIASDWARSRGFNVVAFPADWKRQGRAAGILRNIDMLKSGADLVVAFPGGRGTADMVSRARSAGVEIAFAN